MKRRHYDQSQKQGVETFAFLERVKPDCVVTDCPMCDYRIGTGSGLRTLHPVELLCEAVHSLKDPPMTAPTRRFRTRRTDGDLHARPDDPA
jgi:hypothetical protein